MAKFEIHGAFRIKERGIVFIGVVLEGIINTGDHIHFHFKGEQLKRIIKNMELVRTPNQKQIGIMINSANKKEDAEMFKGWEPDKIVAEVKPGYNE